jgi:hypothetical protein
MKNSRKAITFFIFVFVIILIITLIWFTTRTIYNEENATGNTPGNLFNGGLFSVTDDTIYFSNPNDDGALYQMNLQLENVKKIHDDKVGYINAVGEYLYYVRMNNTKENNATSIFSFKNVGIFRLNLNGKNLKVLYDDPSGLMNLYGNHVYYQHYNSDEGLSFYSVNINGKDELKISDDGIMPISIKDNKLYYSGTEKEHNINVMDLNTGRSNTIFTGNTFAPILINNYIYYISLSDNFSIYRIDLDGTNPTIVVNERCSTYNISEDGDYLYYQVDGGDNNRIVLLDLKTNTHETLLEGDYKNIHTVGDYIFFRNFSETVTYYLPIGTYKTVYNFNPPKKNKK